MPDYKIEKDWVGEHDYDPPCVYNPRVGCDRHRCEQCGWNPFVSLERIAVKYGADAVDYLTCFGD